MSPSPENLALAKYLHSVLGGSPRVFDYWDDQKQNSVDILSVNDVPNRGISTYSTLRLSDCAIGLTVDDVPLRVEFLIPLKTEYEEGGNYIATSALSIINDKVVPKPGVILPRVLELYRPEGQMKHMMLVPPSVWEVKTQEFSSKIVAWLQLVPLSDAERDFAISNGSDALEHILEKEQADVTNLERPSTL
jgi:antitoxin YqcF